MDRGGFIRAPERAALDGFPGEVDAEELIGSFELSDADLDFVWQRRSPVLRLATGLQIGALRLLGFVPEDLSSAPPEVVGYVASQVRADPQALNDLDRVRSTTWRMRVAAEAHLGFRRTDPGDLKGLRDWLCDRANEHDQPWVLFRSGCEWLKSERIVRPGVTVLERAVMAARQEATERTFAALSNQLDAGVRRSLDAMLVVDGGECVLTGLRRSPTGRVAAQIAALVDRLESLRSLGGERFDVEGLAPNRVRFLAGLGRRMSPSAIARLAPARRYQILVCVIVDSTARTIDHIIDLFDTAVTAINRPPRPESTLAAMRRRALLMRSPRSVPLCSIPTSRTRICGARSSTRSAQLSLSTSTLKRSSSLRPTLVSRASSVVAIGPLAGSGLGCWPRLTSKDQQPATRCWLRSGCCAI